MNEIDYIDSQERLHEVAEKLGIELSEFQINALLSHLEQVIEINKHVNLTAIKNIEDGIYNHIEDSLTSVIEMRRIPEGCFCDLGTGGGFPGIPLSIITKRTGLLIDSTAKKIKAVNEIIGNLNLQEKLDARSIRAEELALEETRFKIVIARAVSSLPSLVELAAPLLEENGYLIAMKGSPSKEEVNAGNRVAEITGMQLESERTTTISPSNINRTIIVYRRIGNPKIRLPRRTGLAQHNPLA